MSFPHSSTTTTGNSSSSSSSTEVRYKKQSGFDKFRLLMWKNILLKRRRPIATLIEISLPLMLFIILVLVRHRKLPEERSPAFFDPQCLPSNGIPCLNTLSSFNFSNYKSSSTRRSILSDNINNLNNININTKDKKATFDFEHFDDDFDQQQQQQQQQLPSRLFAKSLRPDLISNSISNEQLEATNFLFQLLEAFTAQEKQKLESSRNRRVDILSLILEKKITYAPKGGDADIIITTLKQEIAAAFGNLLPDYILNSIFLGFDTEAQMVERGVGNNDIIMGVAFRSMDISTPGNPKLPLNVKNVDYAIRVLPEQTPKTTSLFTFRPYPNGDSTYYKAGFIFFQDFLERALIRFLSKQSIPVMSTYLNQFPFPTHFYDGFASAIATTFPLLMTLSFVYSVSMLVKSIVYEKEQRLKEIMKMMGLSTSVYWASWYTISFLLMASSAVLVTLIVMVGGVLQHSDGWLVLIFLLSFVMSTISLTFLISVFFSRARLAAACAGIVYFTTYLPYVLVQRNSSVMLRWHKYAASLCSTTAFGIGSGYIANYETRGDGITFNNYDEIAFDDNFSFKDSLVMMFVDSFIYLVLAWYIEGVFPGKYGVPRPWYFPFTKNYWVGEAAPKSSSRASHKTNGLRLDDGDEENYNHDDDDVNNGDHHGLSPEECETEPLNLPVGIHIRNLHKKYENGKVALQNLSMKMFEGHITALLGHNGAGKTTTMSILTGLFPPTSGTATVNGYDICTNMDGVRQSLGICPQYNVLFDVLTVREHMEFYSALKGVEKTSIGPDVDAMIKSVGLTDKANALSSTLSGGMKRKLSVAIAFVGGSKTVILDEPTAGVDPYARRAIWDLLIQHKHGRAILLSTHHMDEADLLADRIAIIAEGRLRCIGSSLFLKNRFGIGYHMTLVKSSESTNEAKITHFLQSHVPTCQLTGDVGAELSYVLPTSESPSFARLFSELESKLKELGIASYGISVTTLEEVFLRVGEIEEEEEEKGEKEEAGSRKGKTSNKQEFSTTNGQTKKPAFKSNGSNGAHNGSARLELQLEDPGESDDYFENLNDHNNNSNGINGHNYNHKFVHPRTNSDAFAIELGSLDDYEADVTSQAPMNKQRQHQQQHQQQHSSDHSSNKSTSKGKNNSRTPMRLARDMDEVDMAKINHVVLTGFALRLQQIYAMTLKRIHHARRDRKAVFSQIFVPAAFICIAMAIALIYPPPDDQPQLVLNTGMFTKHNVMFYAEYDNNTNSHYNSSLPALSHSLVQNLLQTRLFIDEYQNVSDKNLVAYDLANHLRFQQEVFAGFTFENEFPLPQTEISNVTIWYRNEARHGIATFLNRFHNVVLSHLVNSTTKYSLNAINHPWPKTAQQKANEYRRQGTDLVVGLFIIIAFSFVPASFVLYLVSERQSKSKHMQFVSGVDSVSYWVATFAWDLFTFMFPIIVSLIIFVAFNDEAYNGVNFKAVGLLFLFYAWAMTPLMYCLSFLFEVAPTAYVTLICANLITGLTSTVATFMLDLFQDDPDLIEINQILKKVFLILPNYCMGRGIMDLAINQLINQYLETIGQSKFEDPLSLDIVGANLIWMAAEGIFFFILVLVIERAMINSAVRAKINELQDKWLRFKQRVFRRGGSKTTTTTTTATTSSSSTKYNKLSNDDAKNAQNGQNGHDGALLNIVDEETGAKGGGEEYDDYDDDDDDSDLPEYVRNLRKNNKRNINNNNNNNNNRDTDSLNNTFAFTNSPSIASSSNDITKMSNTTNSGHTIMQDGIAMIVEDEDVIAERARVAKLKVTKYTLSQRLEDQQRAARSSQRASGSANNQSVSANSRDIIIVKNLCKSFQQADVIKMAVNNISIGIKTGECFGLLGVNGAGKTTTFRMLTGDTVPTSGSAFLDGYSIATELRDVRQRIGYCPQFDALNELLTARELLFMYARLRGLLEPNIPQVVDWCIKKLQLQKYADRPCGTYSGGNKRKLSTAIALVGNPAVIFMDEPTTGMDPKARRFLWDVISSLMMNGRSIVFTSHSMEECEALCTRMAIMVNGRFRCLGSAQHLKSRYGVGYTLIAKVKEGVDGALEGMKKFIVDSFPDALLKEEHSGLVQYQLPTAVSSFENMNTESNVDSSKVVTLATVFGKMEEARKLFPIEDYSVNQTTLEQVFVGFARFQNDTATQ